MIKREKDGSVSVKLSDLDLQRVKRHVRKTQEHLSTLAADLVLTEAEAERLGLPPGSSLTDLSRDNLGVLANHYLEESMDITYTWRVYRQTSGSWSRRRMFADARLETLRRVMGDDEFDAAIAEKDEEWTRKFADTDEAERNLAPCRTCGEPRVFASLSYHLDDSICARCEHGVEEAELGPCVSCGKERQLVGSAHTEGRCHDCATRELAPCKQCGGARFRDGRRDGGLCSACLDRQFEPCSDCGRALDSWASEFGDTLCFECTGKRWRHSTCPSCGGQRAPHSWGRDPGALCGTCEEQRLGPCISCGSPLRLRDKGNVCGPCRVNRHFNLPKGAPSS
jgi:hypothetical protein